MSGMIHPLADVQSKKIGDGTKIWQFCIVLANAVIGKNCNINCQVFIENDVVIGDNVTIKSGVQLWNGIRIGKNVFIGPNVTFTNDLIPRSNTYPLVFKNTFIEDDASIGANSTILAGIKIGRSALIGAGSVVTKNVPPFTVWYGNPAKQKGYISYENVIIDMNLKDKIGNDYILVKGIPQLIKK
jgi:UDP-2-acetamido-3-amino-2,3-dideoxy-glucuronate N-acetyltransferase